MNTIPRILFAFACLLGSLSFSACGAPDAALDVDDTPAGSIAQALDACGAEYTCPTPKTCGSWSAYSDCGTVGTSCQLNENCTLCGRGSCNNGGYRRYRQRTRNCTLSGGVPCVERQVSSYLTCECYAQ